MAVAGKEETFKLDGPLYRIADAFCGMVIIGILWVICSIPLVTMGAATTAAYYATAKAVRMQNGKVTQEFFKSFRQNMRQGFFVSILYLVFFAAAVYNGMTMGKTALGVWLVAAWVVAMLFLMTCFFLSRFTNSVAGITKMAMLGVFRHFHLWIPLSAMAIAFGTVIYVWTPGIMFLPGLWMYLATYLVERILQRYMPKEQGEPVYDENGQLVQKWYHELAPKNVKVVGENKNNYRRERKELHRFKKYGRK